MSHDHQLKRITDKITELQAEQERLVHASMRNRREEQYELDRVRRDFTARTNAITHRQESLTKELRDKKREQERIERMIQDDQDKAAEEERLAEEERERKNRRH